MVHGTDTTKLSRFYQTFNHKTNIVHDHESLNYTFAILFYLNNTYKTNFFAKLTSSWHGEIQRTQERKNMAAVLQSCQPFGISYQSNWSIDLSWMVYWALLLVYGCLDSLSLPKIRSLKLSSFVLLFVKLKKTVSVKFLFWKTLFTLLL